jgi:hypothetical protein
MCPLEFDPQDQTRLAQVFYEGFYPKESYPDQADIVLYLRLVFGFVFTFQEQGMQLQVSAHTKSLACTSTSHSGSVKSWACVCIGWCVFRAVLLSSHVEMYWGLCACLHVTVYGSPQDLVHVVARIQGWSCICLRLQASKAVNVST